MMYVMGYVCGVYGSFKPNVIGFDLVNNLTYNVRTI
jgi:hypothetical protein